MGNSTSQRVNSPSSGLSFSFFNSVTRFLTAFSKRKPVFIPKHLTPASLTVAFHETIPLNASSNYILFRKSIAALHLLYSAPGELWNWEHPKPRDYPANYTISARDGILIPISINDIVHSEEYTCIVSNKQGYAVITHLYGDTVIDCHPISESMAAVVLGRRNHRPVCHRETVDDDLFVAFLKKCYICRNDIKKMTNVDNMHKGDAICSKECEDCKEATERNMVKENKS